MKIMMNFVKAKISRDSAESEYVRDEDNDQQ
jgi:hypothetical protein